MAQTAEQKARISTELAAFELSNVDQSEKLKILSESFEKAAADLKENIEAKELLTGRLETALESGERLRKELTLCQERIDEMTRGRKLV